MIFGSLEEISFIDKTAFCAFSLCISVFVISFLYRQKIVIVLMSLFWWHAGNVLEIYSRVDFENFLTVTDSGLVIPNQLN